MREKCKRPGCEKLAQNSNRDGYCTPHAYALGIVKPWVDHETARVELDRLLNSGMSLYRIGLVAGIDYFTLKRFNEQPNRKMKHTVYEALRNVKAGNSTFVTSWPISRRIQALMALGWTTGEIAEQAGVSASSVRKLAWQADKTVRVRADIAEAIREAYGKCDGKQVRLPLSTVRSKAWPPPAAWDNIDDPEERPYRPVPKILEKTYRITDRKLAEWMDVKAHYGSRTAAARALNIAYSQAEKIEAQHGQFSNNLLRRIHAHWLAHCAPQPERKAE